MGASSRHERIRPPLFIAGAMAIAGLWLLGCAGHRGAPAARHVVVIRQVAFQPAEIDAAIGDTIEWRNQDLVPHTASAIDKSWDSGNLAPDSSWRWIARTKGTIAYACRYHTQMHGVLNVR